MIFFNHIFLKISSPKFNKLLLAICLLLCSINSVAQSPIYFRKTYGDTLPYLEDGLFVKTLSDGYLTGGDKGLNSYNKADQYIIKLTEDGTVNWQTFEIDTLTNRNLNDCIVKGNIFYFSGMSRNVSTGRETGLMTKADTSGNIIWSKMVGDSIHNIFYQISASLDGNNLLCGHIKDTVSGNYYGYLVKTNDNGDKIWARTFAGTNINDIYNVMQLPDSSLIMCGGNNLSLGSGDVWLIKADSQGLVTWDTTYNFNNNFTQFSNQIIPSFDGNYILAGLTGNDPFDFFRGLIFKITPNGQILWQRLLAQNPDGSGSIYSSVIRNIYELPDHSLICAGSISPNNIQAFKMLLLKLDPNGNEIWRRTFTPNGLYDTFGFDMDTVSDGGFIISGRTDNNNDMDVYLVKTNCLGYTYPPSANFSSTFDGTAFTFYNLSDRADTCIYYFGDGTSTTVLLSDTIPIVHQYSGSGPFFPYLVAYACGESDTIFQTVYTNTEEIFFDNSNITIYPIPAKDELTISFTSLDLRLIYKIKIIDLSGRTLMESSIHGQNNTMKMDVSKLSNGMYFLKVEAAGSNTNTIRFQINH